jgi:hypothetical protein
MAIKHHPELMKNVINCSPVSADLKLHDNLNCQKLLLMINRAMRFESASNISTSVEKPKVPSIIWER